ncbi:MAG: restriction endonuclease [Bdellovibrionales bacterium]|nr:restriction endonuclease [Ramlibacter sp.]
MAPNSLFAVLLRSPWWYSIGIAMLLAAVSRMALPPAYVVFGAMGALPFIVIGGIAGWRQFRRPSEKAVTAALDAAARMPWREFADALEAAYRRDGYDVERTTRGGDFRLSQSGKVTMVSAKRWKAANLGVETLRELATAAGQGYVQRMACIALGSITLGARQFASDNGIQILQGTELAALLSRK